MYKEFDREVTQSGAFCSGNKTIEGVLIMTYMLNDIDEAIDRKFLVTKTLSNQVQAGTIVHIMDALNNKDGTVTVYYRITYTKQDYTVKFDNVKQFCKWARPDNFIARHYESFNIKEIQRYVKLKDRTFTSFCLPLILVAVAFIWAICWLLIGKETFMFILAAVLTVAAAVLITFTYRSSRQKELIKLYSKVSANSNWRVNFK